MAFSKARALQTAEKLVSQGKIPQAIKQYQEILENDPSDVSLLNTVGDLYIRERNITDGLRHFHKLAEAYVREGFYVKAIAIYRKISKVDPNSVNTLLKLGELYQLQGFSREAREQYLQAAEFFKKRIQTDRVLDVLHKLVQIDPENISFRNRLAAECEEAGKLEDAAQTYLESAEISLRRGDHVATENALKKAAELTPSNNKIQILRARVAITCHQPEEAEVILTSVPGLEADPAVKRILLDAYLGAHKLPEAEKVGREIFEANPSDFAPIAAVSSLLSERGEVDQAFRLLSSLAVQLISQNNTRLLLDALRGLLHKAPQHVPTLELMHKIYEQTRDEPNLPVILKTLGNAYEHAGNLEKAEVAYLELVERDPGDEGCRALLNAVQKKLGREIKPEDFAAHQMPLAEDEELQTEVVETDADQEAMLREALENSDLFTRYNLPGKAISELEKVLQTYPNQIEVHRRILEICRKGYPERGAQAAAELARIFTERGEEEMASKYQAMAAAKEALQEIPLPPPPVGAEVPNAPGAAPGESSPQVDGAGAASPPLLLPPALLDAIPSPASSAPVATLPAPPQPDTQTVELDLTGDLEALTAHDPEASIFEPIAPPPGDVFLPAEPAPHVPPEAAHEATTGPAEAPAAPAKDPRLEELKDSMTEVEFYLENGFVEEARQTIAKLEEKYPGSPAIAELHQRLVENPSTALAQPTPSAASTSRPAEGERTREFKPGDHASSSAPEPEAATAQPAEVPPLETILIEDEFSEEEWELPTSYAGFAAPGDRSRVVVPPPGTQPEPPPASGAASGATPSAGSEASNMLRDLAADFAGSVDRAAALAGTPPANPLPLTPAPAPAAAPAKGPAQLSGLLSEMEESDGGVPARDDPETHYNLGVAFREMGLLDEAIGEFQKVVKIGGKGNFPPNFLQVCSLLAICFMEKKMPTVAGKWYIRALETPGLDEDAQLALQYDLGVAYEQAGEPRKALERFTEVYSQNIDFRDVAEKIRELQQKA